MSKLNFLLGRGERLTDDVIVRGGGGPKQVPYSFTEAKGRLAPMLDEAVRIVDELPDDACPSDETILMLTLNPEYIAKTYFPAELLQDVGIEVVGSRPRKVTPEKRSRARAPEMTLTTELFTRGTRRVFREWSVALPNWSDTHRGAKGLVSVEEVAATVSHAKIKGSLPEEGMLPMEIVLHASELECESVMLNDFDRFLEARGIPCKIGRHFFFRNGWRRELSKPCSTRGSTAPSGSGQDYHAMGGIRKHGSAGPPPSILRRGGSTPIRDCSKLRQMGKRVIRFPVVHPKTLARCKGTC